jgi:hypothetical protein
MRFARLVGIAVLLSLNGSAASTAAEDAVPASPAQALISAPQWRAGSSWEYSDGYGLRVSSTEDGTTVFERLDAPGQWFSMRGFLRQDAETAGAKRQTIFRTVNPAAGDTLSTAQPLTFQREYLSNKRLVVHATSWSVEGRERITVPAGTFDCWVMVWRARSLKSDWTGFERWWYSPQTQQYVRLEYKYGNAPTASRVLMRYHLSDGTGAVAKSANVQLPEIAPLLRRHLPVAELAPIALSPAIFSAVEPLPLPGMQMTGADAETPDIKIASAAAMQSAEAKSARPAQTVKTKAKRHKARLSKPRS